MIKIIPYFDYSKEVPEYSSLIEFWLPAICKEAVEETGSSATNDFFIAIVRLALSFPDRTNFTLKVLSETAGYPTSAFYRLFSGYRDFTYDCYIRCARLTIKVYENYLFDQVLTPAEFARFSANFLYSAHSAIPSEMVKMLWEHKRVRHSDFHPHLDVVANVMKRYLEGRISLNLKDSAEVDLFRAISALDLDILESRLDPNRIFPSCQQYNMIESMFEGFLSSLIVQSQTLR